MATTYLEQLLLQAGDVEMNPGPKDRPTKEYRDQDFDSILQEVAEEIQKDTDIYKLGGKLEFEYSEIKRYIEANKIGNTVTYMGTLDMLHDWKKKTKRSEEREKLKKALNASNHQRLADDLLNDPMATNSNSPHLRETDNSKEVATAWMEPRHLGQLADPGPSYVSSKCKGAAGQLLQPKYTTRQDLSDDTVMIRLEKHGIEVRIPPNEAYRTNDVTVEPIHDIPPELVLKETEAIISFGLRMSPLSSATCDIPVTVTMPHCGIFTKPEAVEVVTYYRKNVAASPRPSSCTSVAFPFQDTSAAAGVVVTVRTSDTVSDGNLTILAAHVPYDYYIDLSMGLGIAYNEASCILLQHGRDYKAAMRECLSKWKNKTGGSFTELKKIIL